MGKLSGDAEQGRSPKKTAKVGKRSSRAARKRKPGKAANGFSEMPQALLEGMPVLVPGENRKTKADLISDQLAEARRSVASASSALAKANVENARLRKHAREAQREVAKVKDAANKAINAAANASRDGLQYRIGSTVLMHLKKPVRLPMLPVRLWKTYREFQNEKEAGSIQTVDDVRGWFRQHTKAAGTAPGNTA